MGNNSNLTSDLSSAIESPANRFYRTVWRWHFYAGLFVIPFMLILAITGSIYLFKPQLDTLMYRNLMTVQPTGTAIPYTTQLTAVQQIYPNATVTKITPNIAPDRSTEVALTTDDEQNLLVFVNPYTAQILGDRDEDQNFQAQVRKIHGELMLGKIGDTVVELAACWGLVLIITGLYLWLPRKNCSIWGTLLPRLKNNSRRIVWRDLHAIVGFYGTLLVGFLILTGLPWSGFWGETFAQIWNRFPAQMFDNYPQSTLLTGTLNQHGIQTVPWAVEQLLMPQSGQEHQHNKAKGGTLSSYSEHSATPINLDAVVAVAQANGAPAGFSISFPEDKTGVYTVSAFPNDPTQEITLHIDQYSSQVLTDIRWQDYGLVPKAVEMGIAIHMGKYFGLPNQLLMLFACLIVILLCISGAVMWWQRRPTGRLGAPAMPAYVQQWQIPIVIIAVSGLVFPLVGISLAVVLLIDYFVISRIALLRRILN